MKLVLPKSVKESQKFVTWAFPVLLGYAISSIPFAESVVGIFAIALGACIVLTGWSSFGAINEDFYNDALLTADLCLLSLYFLLIH